MAKLVSKTYGEALFEIAMESGEDKAQELMEEIRGIEAVLSQNPEFNGLMEHPGIPKQEKLQTLKEVFHGRVSEELESFLEIIVSKERYKDMTDIFSYFVERVKETKKMEMHYAVDQSIIGGMIIRINDRVVDSSVRTKLDGLKKQLLQIQLG